MIYIRKETVCLINDDILRFFIKKKSFFKFIFQRRFKIAIQKRKKFIYLLKCDPTASFFFYFYLHPHNAGKLLRAYQFSKKSAK